MQLFAERKYLAPDMVAVAAVGIIYGEFVSPRENMLLEIKLHTKTSLC